MSGDILFNCSILKTLRFNFHYFGLKGFKFPCLISRNFILKKLGGEVVLNNYNTGIIRLGFGNVGIFDKKKSKGVWENNGYIEFIGRCFLGHGTKISNSGKIIIGDKLYVNSEVEIISHKSISFGDNVLISWKCLIMDSDFHSIWSSKSGEILNLDSPISIGNHVWIGCRNVILKGANIPENSVVASNSTISKQFTQTGIILGGINKVLKENINWGAVN